MKYEITKSELEIKYNKAKERQYTINDNEKGSVETIIIFQSNNKEDALKKFNSIKTKKTNNLFSSPTGSYYILDIYTLYEIDDEENYINLDSKSDEPIK